MKVWIFAALFAIAACQATPPSVHDISQEDFINQPPANALILDVRSHEEFARGHVPNAVLIPHTPEL